MSGSAHTRTTQTLSPYTAERKQETGETPVVVKPPAVLGIARTAAMLDAQTPPAVANAPLRYGDPAGLTPPADSVRTSRAAGGRGCIICGATARDAAGTVKHEGACPLFMRGPEQGGDPHEWCTLFST